MESHSRKQIVRRFVGLQAFLWLLLAFIALLSWTGAGYSLMLPFLIIGYSLIMIVGGIIYPAWFSWMGDLVPQEKRGRYFSRRSRIAESFGISLFFISGFVLDFFKTNGLVLLGFALFFTIASISRFTSFSLLKQQYEPKLKIKKNDYFSFWAFIKRYDNYGKFAVSYALFNFAIMVASPFFAVYMLRELHFNYVYITLITLSSSVFYLLFLPVIGRFSDRFGNRNLFYLSSFLFGLNPILWIFLTDPWALIFIPQLIVGLANAALVIGIMNFTYDSTSPKHRGLCVAYMNVLGGTGVVIGSLLGGILLDIVPLWFGKPFIIVFSLAAILRLAIPLFFISQIKESKKKQHLHLPKVNIAHPLRTVQGEIHWVRQLLHEKKAQKT
jgi:MFS family permease